MPKKVRKALFSTVKAITGAKERAAKKKSLSKPLSKSKSV